MSIFFKRFPSFNFTFSKIFLSLLIIFSFLLNLSPIINAENDKLPAGKTEVAENGKTDKGNSTEQNGNDASTHKINLTENGQILNWPLNTTFTAGENNLALPFNSEDLRSNKFSVAILSNDGKLQPVFNRNEHEKFLPATMTKIFTALIAYEKLSNDLNKIIQIRPEDVADLSENGARIVGFKIGEEVSVADLFYATIMESGGDAARALARLSYGDEASFVKAMNSIAGELGLQDSKFSNCTGLTVEGDSTSTYDMSIIMGVCATRPQLVKMLCTAEYTTSSNDFHPYGLLLRSILFNDINNARNQSAERRIYIQGGRAGWSPDGLFNLMSFSHVGKKILICVSGGANEAESRFFDHDNIFTQLIGNQHDVTILNAGQVVGKTKLINGSSEEVELVNGPDNYTTTLPTMLMAEDVEIKLQVPEKVTAPIVEHEELGKIVVMLNNQVLHETPALAKENYSTKVILGISNLIAKAYNKAPGLFVAILILIILALLFALLRFNKKQKAEDLRLKSEAAARLEQLEKDKLYQAQELEWQALKEYTFSSSDDPYAVEKRHAKAAPITGRMSQAAEEALLSSHDYINNRKLMNQQLSAAAMNNDDNPVVAKTSPDSVAGADQIQANQTSGSRVHGDSRPVGKHIFGDNRVSEDHRPVGTHAFDGNNRIPVNAGPVDSRPVDSRPVNSRTVDSRVPDENPEQFENKNEGVRNPLFRTPHINPNAHAVANNSTYDPEDSDMYDQARRPQIHPKHVDLPTYRQINIPGQENNDKLN